MNDDQHDLDLAAPYVLDAMTPEEREAYELHLAGCATCRQEVASLRSVANVLPLAVEPVEPAPGLRDRVVAAARAEPARALLPFPAATRDRFRPWLAALAVAAAVLIALGIWNLQLRQTVDNQNSTLALQRAVDAALIHGATVSTIAGTGPAPHATALVVQPLHQQHGYLIVEGLPSLSAARVYQVWLIHNQLPQSAGVFSAGHTVQVVPLSRSAQGYQLAAVTIEPGPRGSPGPTGPKVLLGALKAA